MVQVLLTRDPGKGISVPEMVNTITATTASNITSSLTLASKQALTQRETYFTEQTKMMKAFMMDNERQITQVHTTALKNASMMETFKTILTTSEENIERTQRVVTEIREQNIALLRLIGKQHQADNRVETTTSLVQTEPQEKKEDQVVYTPDTEDTAAGLDEYGLEIHRRAQGVLQLERERDNGNFKVHLMGPRGLN